MNGCEAWLNHQLLCESHLINPIRILAPDDCEADFVAVTHDLPTA